MTTRISKTAVLGIVLALLGLGPAGCVLVDGDDDSDDLDLGGGGGGSDDRDDDGNGGGGTETACVVGTWSFSGPTGVGDCYPISSIEFGNTVRFEQQGDKVYMTLIGAGADEYIADASYRDLGFQCELDIEVRIETESVRLVTFYTLTADNAGTIDGDAFLIGDVGTTCQQQFDVAGAVQ